jgi:hypothetical protein
MIEAEPNDSPATAHKIELGARLSGYFHAPQDVDYFRIYVDGIPVEAAAGQLAAGQAIGADAGAPGEEKIADAASVAEQPADAGAAPQPGDPLAAVADKTPAEHVVRVTAIPTREKARIGLASTGGAKDIVAVSEPGKEVFLCNQVVDEGFLDIQVRPTEFPDAALQQNFDYELIIEDVAETPGLEIEPNQSAAQADKLLPNKNRVGYVATRNDVDVYAFAVPFPPQPAGPPSTAGATGTPNLFGSDAPAPPAAPVTAEPRTIRLLLGANPANLGFELRDDEGGLVAQVNRAGAGGEERLQIDLPPGLYFMHVKATHGSSCKPYDVSYDLLP